MPAKKTPSRNEEELRGRIAELEIRLAEAEETLRAIREGEVDAVVVSGSRGEQIFSLTGTDSIYRVIVETMKEAAFTVTFDGTVLFCNARFGEFVKRPLEQIVGRPLQEFVAKGDRAAASSLLLAARQRPVKRRLVFLGTEGRAVPAHVSANVLHQPDGPSICVVASDLTELENSTELIRRLRRQQEELRAANEDLEGFTYTVSHDLRAPLRNICGFAQLLERGAAAALDEKNRHYLEVIGASVRHLDALIEGLLSFSHTGRADMKKQRVSLDALAAEVVEEVKAEMPGRKILWVVHPLPAVTGDAALLKLALFNLVHNAAKYSGKKPAPKVEIGHIPGAAEDTIFVRDNGEGFDMNYAGKLFGLFQRLQGAREFPGTGLGLANVKRSIQRHGGRTWAEGVAGQGATFYFALPRREEGDEGRRRETHPARRG